MVRVNLTDKEQAFTRALSAAGYSREADIAASYFLSTKTPTVREIADIIGGRAEALLDALAEFRHDK